MSESPLKLPPYVSRRSESHLPAFAPASRELDADESGEPVPRPVREGLPASYRMRAEPHYVEALSRPRQKKPVSTEPPPADVRMTQPADRALVTATEALSRAIHSIQASLADVGLEGRSLRDRMLLELARAETVRAAWVSEAVSVLQREPLPRLDQVNLGAVIGRVADALATEQRLTGQTLAVARAERPVTVFGDERLLTVAVGSMVHGMAACVGAAGLSRVTLRLMPTRDGATRGVEVSQTAVRMPAAMLARLFEMDWPEHPGGGTAAVLLAAAQRIAAVQGGTLDARPVETGGCRLVLALPAAE